MTDDEIKKWQTLGDRAADFALIIQTSATAPRRIVRAALDLIELHRDLRPEMYGPRVQKPKGLTQDDIDGAAEEATKRKTAEAGKIRKEDEPDFYGELIEPPEPEETRH